MSVSPLNNVAVPESVGLVSVVVSVLTVGELDVAVRTTSSLLVLSETAPTVAVTEYVPAAKESVRTRLQSDEKGSKRKPSVTVQVLL